MLWMLLLLAERELFTTNVGSNGNLIVIDPAQKGVYANYGMNVT